MKVLPHQARAMKAMAMDMDTTHEDMEATATGLDTTDEGMVAMATATDTLQADMGSEHKRRDAPVRVGQSRGLFAW